MQNVFLFGSLIKRLLGSKKFCSFSVWFFGRNSRKKKKNNHNLLIGFRCMSVISINLQVHGSTYIGNTSPVLYPIHSLQYVLDVGFQFVTLFLKASMMLK